MMLRHRGIHLVILGNIRVEKLVLLSGFLRGVTEVLDAFRVGQRATFVTNSDLSSKTWAGLLVKS
jgi:hypothetical protein